MQVDTTVLFVALKIYYDLIPLCKPNFMLHLIITQLEQERNYMVGKNVRDFYVFVLLND